MTMLKTVFRREVLNNLYSLRFLLSLALLIGVFVAGTVSFLNSQAAALADDRQSRAAELEVMKSQAARNATELAVKRHTYVLQPRASAFITDAKEKYLPNAIVFSAWNVFSFQNRSGSANPFLNKSDEPNWAFIAAVIASFVALLFTFDAVSGEKETKTLALALANPVSRGTLLFGKYLSAVVSVMAVLLAGVLVSFLMLLLLGPAANPSALAAETAGFLVVAGLLTATFCALGLFSSVVAPNSNVSLLLALTFWLAFVVIIPNSAVFVAKNFYPIESSEAVQRKVDQAFEDLNRNAPPGSWTMNSGNPFLPQHELRAALQMKRMQAEKEIRDAYFVEMFHQFESARLATALSPVSLFEYMTEAVAAGGYIRFRKGWNDMHVFQSQFLNVFKALDAADSDSPHWYNPNEDVSTTRKPVAFEKIPQFVEMPMSFGERALPVLKYLMMAVFYSCAVFLVTYVLFVRYDVR